MTPSPAPMPAASSTLLKPPGILAAPGTAPTSTLAELLGVRHPVLSAPMAGVSGGRLAAAVSAAGGLGFIGGGYGDAAWLDEQLALCAGTQFGVGFITWSLRRQPALLQQALAARPYAVHPLEFPA